MTSNNCTENRDDDENYDAYDDSVVVNELLRSSMTQSDTVEDNENDNKLKEDKNLLPLDVGFAWFVVMGSFCVHFLTIGHGYCFGVYSLEYLNQFPNASHGEIAWINGISVGLMCASSAHTGRLADKWGNHVNVRIGGLLLGLGFFCASFATEVWHLYLTQGVLCGIGNALSFVAAVSVITQWFEKYRAVAVGLAVSGSGFGNFLLVPIISYLLKQIGWRNTLRVISIVVFLGLFISSFFIKRRLPLVLLTQSQSSETIGFFQNKNFCFLYFSIFFTNLGLLIPFIHLPEYAQKHGIIESKSLLLLSLVGLSSAFGRAIIGYMADKSGSIFFVFRVTALIPALAVFCWLGFTTFPSLIVFSISYGFCGGGFISLTPVVCSRIFGVERLASVNGVLFTSAAFGTLFSGAIGGFLYDITGKFLMTILFSGVMLLLGAIFTFFINPSDDESLVINKKMTFEVLESTDNGIL